MAVSSTSAGTSSSGLATPGVGSGLDVNTIVSKLMAVEQQPINLLNQKEASFQTRLTAYGSVKGSLSSFQAAMLNLSSPARFQAMTASVGDSSIFTATATADAGPATYAISVDHLAQSQVKAAAGVADQTTASSTGTLTIQVGTGAAKTITISSSNNTLAGLRDAINAADAGVGAAIVNDGSANPYKLVLTAGSSGAANTISITNNLSAGGLSDAVTSLSEVRAARDAALTINGVAIASATNSLTAAIPGVTLNLAKAGDSTLTVARDTSTIQGVVGQFVKSYNDLNSTLSSLTAYNAGTKQGGALLGDSAAQKLQADVRAIVGGAVGSGTLTTLSQLGVSFQKDGSLTLDSGKLNTAIAKNFSDIAPLFAIQGRSSNALLSFGSSTSKTQTGNYQVTVTAAGTRAAATAANAAAVSTVIDSSNDSIALRIDGTASGTLTLTHGTYTATQLAQTLQASINGASPFTAAGISATVSVDSGKLVVTSNAYGATSKVSGATGNALTALGMDGNETATGTNVAGSFMVNGKIISATGSGQTLTGPTGSVAEGLSLKYTGTPAQVVTTPVMTLNLSQGIASKLQQLSSDLLNTTGALTARTDGLTSSIKDLGTRRDAITRRLTQVEATYRKQFNALDTMISSLNQTSSFLTQQLANLTNSTK